MDYLTILSTRSLILFPDTAALAPTKPIHNRSYSSSSSLITTPTGSTLLLPPTPISIPLSSLLYGDTNVAYFLIQHVLASTQDFDPHHLHHLDETGDGGEGGALDLGLGYGFGVSGRNVSKEFMVDAEVIVWKEIDKAKMFVRELGASFGNGNGTKGERALLELAGKYGLGLKEEENEDGQTTAAHAGTRAYTHTHDRTHARARTESRTSHALEEEHGETVEVG